ncbi:MAG: hypothetical protein KKC19_04470 [Nanoarchaeota archaeon]|nr:hypothetical protein [Nanoarchaeota archaeon]
METKRRNFFSAVFTLVGTIIGAGVLGLPYVFAQSGFLIGAFWLIFLGVVMTFLNLWIGEITLRTKKIHQLTGYAEKYLGKTAKKIMLSAIILGVYSALLAYLIGEGQSLSRLIFGNTGYAFLFGLVFWGVMTILLQGGLSRLKSLEFWSVIFILVALFFSFLFLLPDVNKENLVQTNFNNFFMPFGIVLFALLGFNSVPELTREIGKDRNVLKKVIIVGSLIPIVSYLMFSFVVVGVLNGSVSEVATISFSGLFGKLLVLLGIFTMMTSFFVLSFALRDSFIFDFNKKKSSFLYVSIVPLLLYIFVSFFNLAGFVRILGLGGVISGGFTGILILLMARKAQIKGDVKPEYSIPINWFIITVLTLIFVTGIFLEVFA